MQAPTLFTAVPINGAPIQHAPPTPLYNPSQYQYPNGVMQPAPMPSNVGMPGQNGMMRYAIPPPPVTPGHMASQRQKKEIRRRTKTGCLTCRKRRIKCDEGHPTCRNCLKSKRECLGYDPIFKQQTGHANIQPAPANTVAPNSKPIPPSTSTAHQQAHTYPGTGGTFVPASDPTQSSEGAVEYRASLDPALASGEQPLTMASNSFSTTLHATRIVKPITMEQLFSLNDVPPRFQWREAPPPNTTTTQEEIDEFYRFHYAQGLDKLFETSWYSSRGMSHIRQDPSLLDFVGQCVEQFKTQDPSAAHAIQSLEARLVWQLAIMPRAVSHVNIAHGVASDQAILEILPRIDVVEHLLTGQHLSQERAPPAPTAASRADAIEYAKQNFWFQLGSFTSRPDDNPDPVITQAINDALNTMRGILGIMENRDVLYSLAIARYIGGRMVEFDPRKPLVASNDPNDPNDEVSKLEVARRHIDVEDQRGTTQVIQRICGMAIRSWILQKR